MIYLTNKEQPVNDEQTKEVGMGTPVKHTPEPWVAFLTDSRIWCLMDSDGQPIAYASGGMNPLRGLGQDGENMRKAATCVNACEGINPEAVPELLAALKGLRDQQFRIIEVGGADGPLSQDLIESFAWSNAILWAQAEAAIAKAEGGAA
jgi:hypothetical protein